MSSDEVDLESKEAVAAALERGSVSALDGSGAAASVDDGADQAGASGEKEKQETQPDREQEHGIYGEGGEQELLQEPEEEAEVEGDLGSRLETMQLTELPSPGATTALGVVGVDTLAHESATAHDVDSASDAAVEKASALRLDVNRGTGEAPAAPRPASPRERAVTAAEVWQAAGDLHFAAAWDAPPEPATESPMPSERTSGTTHARAGSDLATNGSLGFASAAGISPASARTSAEAAASPGAAACGASASSRAVSRSPASTRAAAFGSAAEVPDASSSSSAPARVAGSQASSKPASRKVSCTLKDEDISRVMAGLGGNPFAQCPPARRRTEDTVLTCSPAQRKEDSKTQSLLGLRPKRQEATSISPADRRKDAVPRSKWAWILKNPVVRVKAAAWIIWGVCFFCVKSPEQLSYMKVNRALEAALPLINAALQRALPTSVGDCNGDPSDAAASTKAPTPCVGESPIYAQTSGAGFGYQTDVLVRWATGLNTLRVESVALSVIPDSRKPIQVAIKGVIKQLKMSIRVNQCFFGSCHTLWDNTDGCCQPDRKFELIIATDCVARADGGADLGLFKTEWFDIDEISLSEAFLGIFQQEVADLTPRVKEAAQAITASVFQGDAVFMNFTFAEVVSRLWRYNTQAGLGCSDVVNTGVPMQRQQPRQHTLQQPRQQQQHPAMPEANGMLSNSSPKWRARLIPPNASTQTAQAHKPELNSTVATVVTGK